MPDPTYIATPPNAVGATSFDPPGTATHIAVPPTGSVGPANVADLAALVAADVALDARLDTAETEINTAQADIIAAQADADTGIANAATAQAAVDVLEALVTTGAGAPSAAASNGAMYLRTDATNGDDALYVRIAGAWVPILGNTA